MVLGLESDFDVKSRIPGFATVSLKSFSGIIGAGLEFKGLSSIGSCSRNSPLTIDGAAVCNDGRLGIWSSIDRLMTVLRSVIGVNERFAEIEEVKLSGGSWGPDPFCCGGGGGGGMGDDDADCCNNG
jgi:hypothetical protein